MNKRFIILLSGVLLPGASYWSGVRPDLFWTMWGHTQSVDTVAFSPDGALIASGSAYDPTNHNLDRNALYSNGQITKRILVDGKIRLWRVKDATLLRCLPGHNGWVNALAFSPDDRLLASASGDGTVKMWRVSDGKLLRTLTGHRGRVTTVAFSPDGRMLASGDGVPEAVGDHTIKVWRVQDGGLLYTLPGSDAGVSDLTFSPDSHILASAGNSDSTIHWWRMPGAHPLPPLVGASPVSALVFSPDGKILASGSTNHTISLWQVNGEHLLHTLTGHTGWVRSLVFSRDGRSLVSKSDDQTLRLWRVSDGQLLKTLPIGLGEIVTFSPDGRLYAYGQGETLNVAHDPLIPQRTARTAKSLPGSVGSSTARAIAQRSHGGA